MLNNVRVNISKSAVPKAFFSAVTTCMQRKLDNLLCRLQIFQYMPKHKTSTDVQMRATKAMQQSDPMMTTWSIVLRRLASHISTLVSQTSHTKGMNDTMMVTIHEMMMNAFTHFFCTTTMYFEGLHIAKYCTVMNPSIVRVLTIEKPEHTNSADVRYANTCR